MRALNARAGLFEHVIEAGAGPGAHIEKDIVDVAETVESEDGLINPAVDRDVRGIEHCRLTDRNGSAGVGGRFSGVSGASGCFGCKGGRIEAGESCQVGRT